MAIRVRCPHCEALLEVAEKYHYQTIACPGCGKEVEAVTTDTIKVSRQFIEEVAGDTPQPPMSEVAPGVFQLDEVE